jgi:hypothetical protein
MSYSLEVFLRTFKKQHPCQTAATAARDHRTALQSWRGSRSGPFLKFVDEV